MIAEGRSINVTLIFSLERYAEVMEAYLTRPRGRRGRPVRASPAWPASSSPGSTPRSTGGSTRSAPTRRSPCGARPPWPRPRSPTSASSSTFSGPRWEALVARGARVQRPLWASTSTKNPAYPDTLYVDTLIGPDTVNTMPEATLDAFDDHGTVGPHRRRRPRRPPRHVLDALAAVGVDLDDVARVARGAGRRLVHQVLRRAARRARHQGRRARARRVAPRARRAGRRRRRARRVRRAGHRGVPRPTERRLLPRRVRRRHRPRAATSAWPTTPAPRSTGGRSTSTGATSAACPTTTRTPTTTSSARRCSSGSAPSTPTTRCSATRAPTRTSCASASSGGSTWSTSASAPTATPPRCSPAPPALEADPGRLVVMNDDPQRRTTRYPRMTLTFAGIARARLVLVTVSGEDKREALARVRAGDPTCPGCPRPGRPGGLARRPRRRRLTDRRPLTSARSIGARCTVSGGARGSGDHGATTQR